MAVAGTVLVVLVPSVPFVLTGFAMLGMGYAVIIPLAFTRAANDPGVSPGQAIAQVATLGYGGMLLGPVLIGGIAGLISLQVAFVLLAVLGCVIVLKAGALR